MQNTKIYAEVLEPTAIEQFESAMQQPFSAQGALMPDAHTGYSLPIGAVVATKDVVVPAWVGYDVGCTDKDTEFLSKEGWVNISEYNNQDILVHDLNTNTCLFEKPQAYVVNNCASFTLLDNKVVNQALTSDHKLLMFGAKSNYPSDILLQDALDKNKKLAKGYTARFKTVIPNIQGGGIDLTENEIRLLVSIQADGCIRKSGKIEYHLKKSRKIDRLQSLLNSLNIAYNIYNLRDDTFGCSFNFSKASKDLSMFWKANKAQLKILCDEVRFWDGHIKANGTITYSSINKMNIDVVQYAFATIGVRANIQVVEYKDKDWSTGYTLYTTKNIFTVFPKEKDIKEIPSLDGKSYCFNTSTGYWVMRRGGRISITGNCGMCALKLTGISKEAVVTNSKQIFDTIYETIPVGFNSNESAVDYSMEGLTAVGKEIVVRKKYRQALGSLGGGNHFIEIGSDEEDNVWVVIHSGSRGVGHGIASYYMTLASNDPTRFEEEFDNKSAEVRKYNPQGYTKLKDAYVKKKLSKGKAKEGHYGFDVASQEGKNYIQDMNWCLDYALTNRKEMMLRVIEAITNHVTRPDTVFNFEALINRNHNHAVERDGLWIHRKGATHAEEGMLGVIPGNMRDGSFIVKGKGNPDSLYSSSHGAGRVLGRRQAKEKLNVVDFKKNMQGITALVGESTLDESPDAYKDIYEVMRLQEDLVEVIAHIKPIINIKG